MFQFIYLLANLSLTLDLLERNMTWKGTKAEVSESALLKSDKASYKINKSGKENHNGKIL